MAVRYAVATGNWSATATWDGGTLPTADDDVYTNNYVVTIDQNITVLSLRNSSNTSPAVTAGGRFRVLAGSIEITCTGSGTGVIQGGTLETISFEQGAGQSSSLTTTAIAAPAYANIGTVAISAAGTTTITCSSTLVGGSQGSSACVRIGGISGTLNIIANLQGGVSSGASAVIQAYSCTVNITGNVSGGQGGVLTPGLSISSNTNAATTTIVGNVTGGSVSSAHGVSISAGTPTLNVTGNVTGGSASGVQGINLATNNPTVNITGTLTGGSAATAYGLGSASNAFNLTVTGDITASSSAAAVLTTSTGATTITAIGTVTASAGFNAIYVGSNAAGSAQVFMRGNLSALGGYAPIVCPRVWWGDSLGGAENGFIASYTFRSNTSPSPTARTLVYAQDVSTFNLPQQYDVRAGITYGPSLSLTGTLDTTTTLSQLAKYVWDYPRTSATESGSMGERLKNASTVDSTGAQVAAYGG